MLSFIITVGGILLYFVLGAILMFPVKLFLWYLHAPFNGISIANKESNTMYLIFVVLWPVMIAAMILTFIAEGVKHAICKNKTR